LKVRKYKGKKERNKKKRGEMKLFFNAFDRQIY